jgi:hypothetical protein
MAVTPVHTAFQRTVAGDERGMADGDARNVGDGIQGSGHPVEGDAKIPGPNLGCLGSANGLRQSDADANS